MIKVLVDGLTPVGPRVPCRTVPPATGNFIKSPLPDGTVTARFGHTLPGVLRQNEHEGLAEAGGRAAAGVTVELRDYQREAVQWMAGQECLDATTTGGGVAGLNGYFWER